MTVRLARWALALAASALLLGACAEGADFPDPSDPVAQIPWPDYELLRYDITDQTQGELGTLDLEVQRQGDAYQFRLLFILDDAQVRDEVTVVADAATLRPRTYERLAVGPDDRLEAHGVYREDADGRPVLDSVVVENGDRREKLVELGDFAFDTDTSAWLWRSITLMQDSEVTYRSVNVIQQRSQLVRIQVVGQDALATPAGDFLAWQIEVRPGLDRQNVWYEVDPPHRLVRWDLEPRRYTLREIRSEPLAGP